MSASITGIPFSLNISATVVLPVAIPPVRPTMNIFVSQSQLVKLSKLK